MVRPSSPPRTLKTFNDIVPGAAERILCMAEGNHKQAILAENREYSIVEKNMLKQHQEIFLGQILGFVLALFTLSFAFYCIYKGLALLAIATVLSEIAVVGGVYL